MKTIPPLLALLALTATPSHAEEPIQLSGIYPHLAMFNGQRECGTGAVVPFADRLWVVTYGPHEPAGSDSKFYEITPDLEQIVRPESIGGTPANRMIHKESNQLFIGPYAVDAERKVRAIPFAEMFGRPTGNARHLFDPAGKIYYATMEEGIYEVDVKTLEVTELFRDTHRQGGGRNAQYKMEGGRYMDLPGYHGKGLFSGQGLLVYANNGDNDPRRMTEPATPSGVLGTWDGKSDDWTMVRRNQFTDVTGPGGITGADNPDTDPIWSIGWDFRSLILSVLHNKEWTHYRLPKSSHSHDGAHGWNTEWPRIREIGEGDDLLMTMHGAFWKFPKNFTPETSAGIRPRSNYLKILGDFALWNGRLVLGCNDTAASEFANKRKAKGEIKGPQSHSNLQFIDPADLDNIGPVIGFGSLWHREPVKANEASDAYLFSGYERRSVQLLHDSADTITVTLEVDKEGNGKWSPLTTLECPPDETLFHAFTADQTGAWVRITSSADLEKATASFHYRNEDNRGTTADPLFAGVAKPGQEATGGLVRSLPEEKRTLAFAAQNADGSDIGYYILDATLNLSPVDDAAAHEYQKKHTAIPEHPGILEVDAASVIFIDDDGSRWRLPKGDSALDNGGPFGKYRIAREVVTERDLLNAHGTFFELPAHNAGGFSKVRPIATHNLAVHDFCSYRGLVIFSGIAKDAPTDNPHILRSTDGKTALWAGAVDDLWKLGKVRGKGGPWKDTAVKSGEVSDPYLLTGYDKKHLVLTADQATTITAEVELTGDGNWVKHHTFTLKAGETLEHTFPDAFSAYWIRFTSDTDCTATATLTYE